MNIPIFSLSFDPVTTADFVARSVKTLLVRLVARGCEGTKVEVIENPAPELLLELNQYSLELIPIAILYLSDEDALKLLDARVIAAKGKWFLQSPQIQSRCWCGTSFSFEDRVVAFLAASEAFAGLLALDQSISLSNQAWVTSHFVEWSSTNTISSDWMMLELQSGTYFITNISAQASYLIAPWATVVLYELIAATDAEEELNIAVLVGTGATLTRRSVVLWVPERALTYRATSRAMGDHSSIDHEMLVYGLIHSQVRVDAIGDVPSGLLGVSLRVHESQIFLGEWVKFRGIPSLSIASHDVVASHSLTTRGIDPLSIAYATSRGLSAEFATQMLIRSQITALAVGLSESLTTHIVSYLLSHIHPKHRD